LFEIPQNTWEIVDLYLSNVIYTPTVVSSKFLHLCYFWNHIVSNSGAKVAIFISPANFLPKIYYKYSKILLIYLNFIPFFVLQLAYFQISDNDIIFRVSDFDENQDNTIF